MNVPYSPSEQRYVPEPTGGYQMPDPTQDAYDRYVHEGYKKQPVRFEQMPEFGSGSLNSFNSMVEN